MSILDPFPLHARTNEHSTKVKRKMIRLRADHLRDLAKTLDLIAADPSRDDEDMTHEANFYLEHS